MPRSWGGRHAAALTAAVLARDLVADLGYAPCHWCGQPADTADHWPIGRVDGGPDTMSNLVAACRSCNSRRGAVVGNRRRADSRPSRRW